VPQSLSLELSRLSLSSRPPVWPEQRTRQPLSRELSSLSEPSSSAQPEQRAVSPSALELSSLCRRPPHTRRRSSEQRQPLSM
jgi:hypothetical protein